MEFANLPYLYICVIILIDPLPLSFDVHAHRGDQAGVQERNAQGTYLDALGESFV